MSAAHLYVMDEHGSWVPLRLSVLTRIAKNTGEAAKPVNEALPVISGSPPMVGTELTTTNGVWFSVEPITSFAYQWKRDGSNISGATARKYTLTADDQDDVITCQVTATNNTGATAATSNGIGPIGGAPVNTVAPAISGTAEEGETLTATSGTWEGFPTPSYAYQWYRSDEAIPGATETTYDLTADDVGETITVTVTATNKHGTASKTSDPTAEVEPAEEA